MATFQWNFTANSAAAQQAAVNIGQLNQTINIYERSVGGAHKSSKSWFDEMTRNVGIWNTWNKGVDFLAKRLSQLSGIFTSFAGKIMDIGGAYEMSAKMLRAYTDASDQEYQKIVERAKAISDTSQFTAAQVLDAATSMSKAGIGAEDLASGLDSVVQAATATGMPLAKAGNVAAVTMKQFAKEGITAQQGLQTLSAAANSSATDIYGMVAAVKNAAPPAALLGITLKDTSTILASFANNGITYSRAGTALNMTLSRLSAPTKQAKEALAKLNINFKELDLSKPAEWLEIFHDRLQGIEKPAEKMAILKPIFGRGATAMIPLIENLKDAENGFAAMQQKIEGNMDSMGKMGDMRMETMTGAWIALQSSIEGVWVRLSEVVKVPFTTFIRTAMEIVNVFNARLNILGKSFKDVKNLADFSKALKTVDFSKVFSGLAEDLRPHLQTMIDLFTSAWNGIKAFIVAAWDTTMQELNGSSGMRQVMDDLKSVMSRAAEEIMDVLLAVLRKGTPAITKIGIEIGTALLDGMLQTPLGKILGAKFAFDFILMIKGLVTTVAPMIAGMMNFTAASGISLLGPLAVGVAGGIGAKMALDKRASLYDEETAEEDKRQLRIMEDYLDDLYEKKREIESQEMIGDADIAKLERINTEIQKTSVELEKLGSAGINIETGILDLREKMRAETGKDVSYEAAAYEYVGSDAYKRTKRDASYDDNADITKRRRELEEQQGRSVTTREAAAVLYAERVQERPEIQSAIQEEQAAQRANEARKYTNTLEDLRQRAAAAQQQQHTERAERQRASEVSRNVKAGKTPEIGIDAENGRTVEQSVKDARAYGDARRDKYGNVQRWQRGTAEFAKQQAFDAEMEGRDIMDGGERDRTGDQISRNAAMTVAAAKAAREPGINDMSVDQLKSKQDELSQQTQLIELEDQLKQKKDEVATAQEKITLKLAESAATFKKWLLEPIDTFKARLNEIKGKFDELVTGLSNKATNIGVKFGLISEEEGKKQNLETGKTQLGNLEDQLKDAQTPGERLKLLQQMSGQAEALAGMTEGGQQQQFAQQAVGYVEKAKKAAEEQRMIEQEKVKIDKDFALTQVDTLEKAQDKLQSPEKQLENLKQLQSAYQSLGKVTDAAKLQEQIAQLQRETAGRQTELLEKGIQNDEIKIALLKKIAGEDETTEPEPVPLDEGMRSP